MHTIYWDWLGLRPIEQVLALQEALFQKEYHGERKSFLLFAEHPHCFTYNYKPIETQLRVPREDFLKLGLPAYPVHRGGNATYHGPGQLVAYWILDLSAIPFHFMDFNHSLTEGVMRFLTRLGLYVTPIPFSELARFPSAHGVWIGGKRKITQRAISALRSPDGQLVTRFGFALNVSTDLRFFSYIFPCGLDIEMTSLQEELGIHASCEEAVPLLLHAFAELYRGRNIRFELLDLLHLSAIASICNKASLKPPRLPGGF